MNTIVTGSRALARLIDESNGRFVTVQFVKADGTVRILNGRTGVTKFLKGGKSSVNPSQFVTIYDNVNKGYRSINRDSILAVSVDGVVAINSAD